MPKDFVTEAKQLLQEPVNLHDIPVQRAVSALGVPALTVGYGKFHLAEYLIYPTNLYLTFSSRAAIDENGNYDSPIFQNDHYNYTEPLWQKFRERAEEKLGTSITQIFFGEYTREGNEEFFVVKDEPKGCHWRYTKKHYVRKRDKDSIFITRITKEQALEYQQILDELRFDRALRIVKDRAAHEESQLCREEAIMSLNSNYPEEFDRFTFLDETFRFRQFDVKFLYTPTGLEAFNEFYRTSCIPYRDEEIAKAEWEEKSFKLEKCLREDEEFASELLHCNVSKFTITQLNDDSCQVEGDLKDDRTGNPFCLVVNSQKFDDILNAVSNELVVVFQRKRQTRRATATLQRLASKK